MFHSMQPFPRTRRGFLRSIGGGFGSVAMAAMAAEQAMMAGTQNPLSPKTPHFKAIIEGTIVPLLDKRERELYEPVVG